MTIATVLTRVAAMGVLFALLAASTKLDERGAGASVLFAMLSIAWILMATIAVPLVDEAAQRRRYRRAFTSNPIAPASKLVAVRRPNGIHVWTGGWRVRYLPPDYTLDQACSNHSGARLGGDWFDQAVYRAVIDLLRKEGQR